GDITLKGAASVPLWATNVTGEAASWSGNSFVDANQRFLGTGRSWRDHQFAGWSISIADTSVVPNPTPQNLTVLDNVGTSVTLSGAVTLDKTHPLTYTMSMQASTYSGMLTSVADATTVTDATNAGWVDHQFA